MALADFLSFALFMYDLTELTVLQTCPLESALNWSPNLDNEKEYKLLLQYLNEGYNIKIVKNSSIYCHSHTCTLEEEYYYNDDAEEEKEINNLIYDLKKKMEYIYHNMCYEIERLAYNYIENISNDEIKEDINYLQNDCGLMFLENGAYYYGD